MADSPRSPEVSTRAGRYVRQLTGYRAFLPADLPPDPAVNVSGSLQVMLSEADRALERLDGSIQTLPNPDLFVAMYVRKEAVLSSQIEGTQSSLQDLLAAEAKIFSPTSPHDVSEVVNYVGAMNYGLNRLSELPVSVRLIREIHERHPDYFFGITNAASALLDEDKVEEAKQLMLPLFNRKRLHVSEFTALCTVQAELAMKEEQWEGAEHWLSMWEQVEPENPDLENYQSRLFLLRIPELISKRLSGRKRR